MSKSIVMDKFKRFSAEYAERQASRPKVFPDSSDETKAAAKEHGLQSRRLLEEFFNSLTTEQREELLGEIDRKDLLTQAIIKEARELHYIGPAK